jgi:hypothetical protein
MRIREEGKDGKSSPSPFCPSLRVVVARIVRQVRWPSHVENVEQRLGDLGKYLNLAHMAMVDRYSREMCAAECEKEARSKSKGIR